MGEQAQGGAGEENRPKEGGRGPEFFAPQA